MAISWQKNECLVEPYSELAIIYDDVMSHVNYETWAEYISKIIRNWHSSATTVIDSACGTGNLLFKLISYNYRLLGFDYSFSMVIQAKKKFYSKGYFIPVWQQDIRTFSLKNPVDIVLCLYDSINYIKTIEGCSVVFQRVSEGLKDKGLFIFDICTEENSIKYFSNYFEKHKGKDYVYTRKSNYDFQNAIHSNVFKINFKKSDVIFVEIHEQKIYQIHEIIKAIHHTPFEIVYIFDGFTFRDASEHSLRVHFVLRKT